MNKIGRLCVFPDEVDYSPLEKILPPRTRIKCVSLSTAIAEYRAFTLLHTCFFLSDRTQVLNWRIFCDYYALEDSVDANRTVRVLGVRHNDWPRNGLKVEKCMDHTIGSLLETQAEQNYILLDWAGQVSEFSAFSDIDTTVRFLHYRHPSDVDSSPHYDGRSKSCMCGRCQDPSLSPLNYLKLCMEFRTRRSSPWDAKCYKCHLVRNIRTNETLIQCSWCKSKFHAECAGLSSAPLDDWVCKDCDYSPTYWRHMRSLNPDPVPFEPIQLPPELGHLAVLPPWVSRDIYNWLRLIVTEHIAYGTLPLDQATALSNQMFTNPVSLFGRLGYFGGKEKMTALWRASPDRVAIYKRYWGPDAAFLIGWNSGHLKLTQVCSGCNEVVNLDGMPCWFYPSQGWTYCTKCFPVKEYRLITHPSRAKVDAYQKAVKCESNESKQPPL